MSIFSTPVQRVDETCSCGAEYRATGMFATTYASEWRDEHVCKVRVDQDKHAVDREVESIRSRWREADLAREKGAALSALHHANEKIQALTAEIEALAKPNAGKGR